MRQKRRQGMSKYHAQDNKDYPRENQVARRGSKPDFEKFPLLPKKESDQDVSDGVGSRPREVIEKKSPPPHCRRSCQKIGHDGWKQSDEPRDKNDFSAITFEKSFGPLSSFWREMEPVKFCYAALAQAPTQPKGTNAAQKAARRAGHYGLPQRTLGSPQYKSGPQKNRFARQGGADVVQEHDDEYERISVMREIGQ